MNKLEEYRDNEAKKTSVNSAFKVGFDTAIALGLPVKFALWVTTPEAREKIWGMNHSTTEDIHKELYKYWINKIYKPE